MHPERTDEPSLPAGGVEVGAVIVALVAGLVGLTSMSIAPDTTGTVYGRVLSAESGDPIPGATVQLRHSGGFRLLLSDEHGAYRATGIAAGDAVLVASALDHAPLQAGVHVPAGGSVPVELRLERRPIVVAALFTSVEADRYRLAPPGLTRGGLREEGETELRALESSPGVAEIGLAQPSGRPDPTDPANVLYVRGAAADLKLVLLDGAPVYAPFHLSGLLDAFPDGVLDRAALYTGGAPARYGGGLSYVLDLEVRDGDPDRFRTAGAVDVLGATARAEGPLGAHSRALVSGRVLHGLGYPAITGDTDLPYGYGDALGRLDVDVGAGHVGATAFWNRESVELDLGKLEGQAPGTAFWGNAAGSLRYRTPLADGTLAVTTAIGRFTTRIPILYDDPEELVSFTTGRGQNTRSRTEAFYTFHGGDVRWAFGGGFDTHETVLDQRTVFGDTTAHSVARAIVGAAWAEAAWEVVPDVELRLGLRADYYEPAGAARLSPRATASWSVDENATLKLSLGRFSQVVRGPESILSADLTGPTAGGALGLDTAAPASLFAVAGATHLVVGLEDKLPRGLDLGLEGYFKSFDGLPGTTNLYSSGGDLWVQAERGPIRGWVGYSLAWVWSNATDDTRFVGRQVLSGGLSSEVRGFDVGVRLAYGAGLPFTEVASSDRETLRNATIRGGQSGVYEPPPPALSGAPDDSYLRIDAEVSRRIVASLGGSPLEIAPYVRLLNALDRRDALFYRAEEDGPTRPAPLASVPLLAVVGVSWAF